eukprot:2909349-Pyramimonas_sp.AAC.1
MRSDYGFQTPYDAGADARVNIVKQAAVGWTNKQEPMFMAVAIPGAALNYLAHDDNFVTMRVVCGEE